MNDAKCKRHNHGHVLGPMKYGRRSQHRTDWARLIVRHRLDRPTYPDEPTILATSRANPDPTFFVFFGGQAPRHDYRFCAITASRNNLLGDRGEPKIVAGYGARSGVSVVVLPKK